MDDSSTAGADGLASSAILCVVLVLVRRVSLYLPCKPLWVLVLGVMYERCHSKKRNRWQVRGGRGSPFVFFRPLFASLLVE